MEEAIRNRIILILSILTVIFFIGTVSSCGAARNQKIRRDKEMATRLDLEEKVSKLENKIANLTQEIQQEKAAHEATRKALLEVQLISQTANEELQKVTKLKEALEEDLKDALVKGKSSKSKK